MPTSLGCAPFTSTVTENTCNSINTYIPSSTHGQVSVGMALDNGKKLMLVLYE